MSNKLMQSPYAVDDLNAISQAFTYQANWLINHHFQTGQITVETLYDTIDLLDLGRGELISNSKLLNHYLQFLDQHSPHFINTGKAIGYCRRYNHVTFELTVEQIKAYAELALLAANTLNIAENRA